MKSNHLDDRIFSCFKRNAIPVIAITTASINHINLVSRTLLNYPFSLINTDSTRFPKVHKKQHIGVIYDINN